MSDDTSKAPKAGESGTAEEQVELTDQDLKVVTGGFNPQPDPPGNHT